ncbi:unnamed protein product [Brachionus calyciflorus]|uniref:FLYWCH-type domain-containing protein n=1 Tax=Brachionus calyciflorus TaxID=104777 RepID=A0A814LA81_9BILA|nr:unnamed protein product [Brachionus calyciflorus]
MNCSSSPLIKKLSTGQTWNLFRSQREGYKLFSLGYTYTVDKPKLSEIENASKIYWKCSIASCTGRAISSVLKPPLTITQGHISNNHKMQPAKLEELESLALIKNQALNSNDNPRAIIRKTQLKLPNECLSMVKKEAMKQIIRRKRNLPIMIKL